MTATIDRLDWTLQQYSIGHVIASGHFGVVYQARHLPTDRDVALKLIPLQGQDSEEKVAAERHGALLQQRFCRAHPRLVPEVFEHQAIVPFYAIAMELVRGQQLTGLLAHGPVPSRRAAEIGLAVARFLEKAHAFETDIEGQHYALIVHADLKPDHILLRDDGEIRVLDFGIAKALAARTLVTTNKWGSVQYASPERLQSDGHVNEHVDFWSLGVMLFEMLAGFRPYHRHEDSVSRLDGAIRKQEARESLPAHIEPMLAALVNKLLAPQIERRYATAAAIAEDIDAYLKGAPTRAGLEQALASQETIRIAGPRDAAGAARMASARANTTPTEPLPATARGAATAPTSSTGKPGTTLFSGARRLLLRAATLFAILVLFAAATSDCAGFARAQRLRAQVPSLEVADVAAARAEYRRIGGVSPIAYIARARTGSRLREHMVALADRTILDYRTDTPPLGEAQWQQALECLDFAAELAPGDNVVAAKRAYVRGQLARIAKRVDEAIRYFRDSARLDSGSPDPYLGLATMSAYSTHDLEALTQAVQDAETRGYKRGRRERAEFGDVHRYRGDQARAAAAVLSGSDRIEQLEHAVADYEKCVEYFDELRFLNSEATLRTCRRRLADVKAQLPAPPPDESLEAEPSEL